MRYKVTTEKKKKYRNAVTVTPDPEPSVTPEITPTALPEEPDVPEATPTPTPEALKDFQKSLECTSERNPYFYMALSE